VAGPAVEPFSVTVTDAEIADLRARLARTRWPDQLPGTTWELGTDSTYLRALCDHWANGYDFAAFVERANRWPQVRTEVDGTTVHAITAPSTATDGSATPLLLLHGWPGSVAEHFDAIELLRPRHHVVAASLPGYGFSGSTTRLGIGPEAIADVLVELMRRLGHERFFVAGGDWGAIVGATLTAHHPEHVIGLHLTLIPTGPPEGGDPRAGVTDAERARRDRARLVTGTGSAYQAIQSTKPQSLAYGLTDSPAGLAGWIIEKFQSWSDCHGDIASVFSMDRLLDNLSIYWFTGTINASIRLYMETLGGGRRAFFVDRPIAVPTGHAVYPGEIMPTPRVWAETRFDIVRWVEMERGGHFASMEVPELYTADLLAFTAQVLAA
jgi:microsomal epoxide hydrolase